MHEQLDRHEKYATYIESMLNINLHSHKSLQMSLQLVVIY